MNKLENLIIWVVWIKHRMKLKTFVEAFDPKDIRIL